MTLLSKLQYNNFEPGEFTGREPRSYEQTIALIGSFPWEDQRDHLRVSLTNPSVSIQDNKGNFLKLALYYNGRFVLHFFTPEKRLYTKSFSHYEETYPYIRAFFDHHPFQTMDLKQEITWGQTNLIHFADKDFRYFLTPKKIRAYLFRTSSISFALTLFLVGLSLWHPSQWIVSLFVFLPVIFFIGGGLNLLLFANYYRYSKDMILVMSKGNPQFSFGPMEGPESYDKKDILGVRQYVANGSKNPVSDFAWVEIGLKNGQSLIIPNLLIDDADLVNKLDGLPMQRIARGWPSIIPAASALF